MDLGDAIHQANIEIDEEGTKAAAVTAISKYRSACSFLTAIGHLCSSLAIKSPEMFSLVEFTEDQ